MKLEIDLRKDKLLPPVSHVIIDNILYYIYNFDSDPVLRLYIPEQLGCAVIKQYHDWNGLMVPIRLMIQLGKNIIGLIYTKNYMSISVNASCAKVVICKNKSRHHYKTPMFHHMPSPRLALIYLVHIQLPCPEKIHSRLEPLCEQNFMCFCIKSSMGTQGEVS